ncbi:hypothetical protein FIE12Z_7434 [Fusarium flagelliforme]|uniref:F-box domain-containing protein n=2 Tax=Fusarium flagelliforme TaxID=2675880 RepID=A0A395MK38_9HYPO|nr:hypothetical protein FIE12Z_7434 [Fusarium flagelliforme]
MPLDLESCPETVVECFVQLLDLDDICNLRLSCKSLALKSSQYRFRTFFRSKHINVTVDALRTFAQGTQAGGLRSLIQELYLEGIAKEYENRKPWRQKDWQKEEISRTQEVNLLSQAFNGLVKYSKNRSLRLLTLRVAIVRNSEETILPADAGPLVSLQKTASNLRIDSLNIFNQPDMQRPSLACDQINAIDWNDSGFSKSFATLRAIHENKHGVGRSSKKDVAEVQAEAEDENDFVGLSRLLRLCNQLGNLEIDYFRNLRGYSDLADYFYYERILQRVVELDRLPILKRSDTSPINASSLIPNLRVQPEKLTFVPRWGRNGTSGTMPKRLRQSKTHVTDESLSVTIKQRSPPSGSWEDKNETTGACEEDDNGKATVYLVWKYNQKIKHKM